MAASLISFQYAQRRSGARAARPPANERADARPYPTRRRTSGWGAIAVFAVCRHAARRVGRDATSRGRQAPTGRVARAEGANCIVARVGGRGYESQTLSAELIIKRV